MAVVKRPGFQVNVDRTLDQTKQKSVFYDIAAGTSHNLRFLPSWDPSGQLFFESAQHFQFTEEGQKRAWACLRAHGEEGQECPVCVLMERAEEQLDADVFEKLKKKHGLSLRWHAQAVPLPKPEKPVTQLYVVGLSKQTAQAVAAIAKMERDNRQPLLTDPDQGQAVNIARNDKSGLATRYTVQSTGMRIALDEIYPKWVEEFMDLPKALALRVVEPERIVRSIRESIPASLFVALFPDVEV